MEYNICMQLSVSPYAWLSPTGRDGISAVPHLISTTISQLCRYSIMQSLMWPPDTVAAGDVSGPAACLPLPGGT